jgi:hypothetical protein
LPPAKTQYLFGERRTTFIYEPQHLVAHLHATTQYGRL